MTRLDFFRLALQHNAWRWRHWMVCGFSVAQISDTPKGEGVCEIVTVGEQYGFVHPDDRSIVAIEDSRVGECLFPVKEEIVLRKGDLANLTKDIRTTYGNAIFNAAALAYCFGPTIPYLNRTADADEIMDLYVPKIVDTPVEGAELEAGKVSVAQGYKHAEAMFNVIAPMSIQITQSSSEAVLGVDPSVIELRDRLLEENKDHLTDLTVVAGIIKQLIAADKATFENDPARGFLFKSKAFDIVRLRTQIMYGVEFSFEQDGTFTLVTRSLVEGWDITKFAQYNNSMRDGSFNRGAMTALGGEAVKKAYRRYQNSKIVFEDCKTPLYLRRRVLPELAKRLVGRFYVEGGKLIETTSENIKSIVGKEIDFRDPSCCRAGGFNLCRYCFGNSLDLTPMAVSNAMSEPYSQQMYIFMKKMHGTSLKTVDYDFHFWLS